MGDILQPPGHLIAYFPAVAKIVGSIKAAILVQQVSFCTKRGPTNDGWIYKDYDDWMLETGLSPKELRSSIDTLEVQEFIEKEYDRANHILRIRLNVQRYNKAIQEISEETPPPKHIPKRHMPKRNMLKSNMPEDSSEKSIYYENSEHMPKEHMPKRHMPKGKVASAKKEDGISQKGICALSNTRGESLEKEPKETDPPENANAFSTPKGEHEGALTDEQPTWMKQWPKSKRFPKDFPLEPPPWFLSWAAEHAPHVDVAHEWPHMRDYTYKATRTQFFMCAQKWMETEEAKHVSNNARASPRNYTQRDTSPEAQERLRQRLQAIDEEDG